MARIDQSNFVNPIISSAQLQVSVSQIDGVPRPVEDLVRYNSSRLLQAAGIVLGLPQEIIAQSIILLQRFHVGQDGGSVVEHDPLDVATAVLYLAAKPTAHSISPRQAITTFVGLAADWPESYSNQPRAGLTEGDYEIRRDCVYQIESHVLRVLGFNTHVALPYALCITYLQALNVFNDAEEGKRLTKRVLAYMNGALFSPQLLYLTHQPCAIATACIYLAAREVNVKLPEVEWWEAADVDREELGFLVLSLKSVQRFARAEQDAEKRHQQLLTVADIWAAVARAQEPS